MVLIILQQTCAHLSIHYVHVSTWRYGENSFDSNITGMVVRLKAMGLLKVDKPCQGKDTRFQGRVYSTRVYYPYDTIEATSIYKYEVQQRVMGFFKKHYLYKLFWTFAYYDSRL
jgi:hypothetical protein